MNKEEAIMVSMGIIANAGGAKSAAMQAIKDANNGKFDKIEKRFEEASTYTAEANIYHMKFLEAEGNDMTPEFSVLLIHAEDQMLTSQTVVDLAKEFVKLAEKVNNLERNKVINEIKI